MDDRHRAAEVHDKAAEHPELMQALEDYHVGKLVEHVYMLPDKQHLELIGQWAERRAQPRHQLGVFPGWGPGTYYDSNLDYYWLIGHFFVPAYWPDVERLWENYLVRSNGECNLSVAYVTAWAAQQNQKAHLWRERIADALADDGLSGNQRLTWLLARAYGEEVLVA